MNLQAIHYHRICLTPTRNEAWILPQFLGSARSWASDIIVADQDSSDGTLDYLRRALDVDVVLNDCNAYEESHRQRLLIDRARKIDGRRVLIALDADEALSANCVESADWDRIRRASPGTVIRFRWVNILPGFQKAWVPPEPIACGFIDDGSTHTGGPIHNRRIPWPSGAPVLDLQDIVVLHFQYVVWERMVSKQRWYQVWEHAIHRRQTPLEIFRGYHHMAGGWSRTEIHPVKSEWLGGYDRANIDFRSLKSEEVTWWDREVLQMLLDHGPEFFRKLEIWDKDWSSLASKLGLNGANLRDPRSLSERIFHRILAATQHHRSNWGVRGFERLLRLLGW